MKTMTFLCLLVGCTTLSAQTNREQLKKELRFTSKNISNTLIVSNIFGDINVEGYDGNTVLVEVEKIIQGKSDTRIETGMNEIKLGVMDLGDTLILYTEGWCHKFGKRKHENDKTGGWAYQWDCQNDCEMEFEYVMNYRIKVPANINIVVSTVNEGNIVASKVAGIVIANNVNGAIRLNDLVQAADAHTINGDVTVHYMKQPKSECRFYTLNGNINADFPKGLSANVNFKSFNGEFYTNVASLDNLPATVKKESTSKGTKYSVSGNTFKANGGGTLLDFETFNGNVYLKEAQ